MTPYTYITLIVCCIGIGCSNPAKSPEKKKNKENDFVMRETLATGDTGYIRHSQTGFRRTNVRDILCQNWELDNMEGASSIELVMDEKNNRIFPALHLFKDGSVLENPRNEMRIGKWRITETDSLVLDFTNGEQMKYELRKVESHNLYLVREGSQMQPLYLRLSSDGMVHRNMHNDPFHPVNNRWRVKPAAPEADPAIKARVLNCIRFFALYYRDVIKRKKTNIDFTGFPRIFTWYSGGIGLPDRDKLDATWIACFYDSTQALLGYDILRRLIVDYEFDWPKAPSWSYQTHSVLEQMYHALDTIRLSHDATRVHLDGSSH